MIAVSDLERAHMACPRCGRRYPSGFETCEICRLTQSHMGSRVELWTVSPGKHGNIWTPPRWFSRAHERR